MAVITSAASGDFSVGATWVGGVVPGVGDDAVAATGHVIVIDVDTTVDKVTQAGTGKYTLGDGRTLTANVEAVAGTFTSGGTVDVTATTTAVINGNVTGVSTTTSNTAGVVVSGTGALTLNGTVTGSAGNNSSEVNGSSGVYTNVTCDITVNGVVNGGTGSYKRGLQAGLSSNATIAIFTASDIGGVTTGQNAYGVWHQGSSGSVTATANRVLATISGFSNAYIVYCTGSSVTVIITATEIISGPSNGCVAVYHSGVSGNVTITGNVIAGTGNSAYGVWAGGSSAVVTAIGDVTGGGGPSAWGFYMQGTSSTINITGDVVGGGGGGAFGVYAIGASNTVNVVGSVTAASTLSHGINSAATANGVIMEGDMTDSLNGAVAIYARVFRMSATNSGVTTYTNTVGYPTGTPVSRVSPDNVTGMASQTDVRLNTVFGFNSELTGSLAVPPANAVGAGVPVDNTTGTAALTPGDIAGLVGAQIAAAVSTPSVP